jgi:hypothetical protein
VDTERPSTADAAATVRIVTWNCHMALARKAPRLLALRPDIAVVQECSAEAELAGLVRVGWCGRRQNKGLGVFARPELNAVVATEWDPTREWFLPVRIDALGLNLLGAWAMNQRGAEDRPKKGRAAATIEHYRSFVGGGRTIVTGDLNNNVFWDTPRSPEFEAFTDLLASMGLVNLYYTRTGDTPGAETRGSLFFLHNAERSYLIDHVFLPGAWLEHVTEFEVGSATDWLDVSDHAPVVLELAIPEGSAATAGHSDINRSQHMSQEPSEATPSKSTSADDLLPSSAPGWASESRRTGAALTLSRRQRASAATVWARSFAASAAPSPR